MQPTFTVESIANILSQLGDIAASILFGTYRWDFRHGNEEKEKRSVGLVIRVYESGC